MRKAGKHTAEISRLLKMKDSEIDASDIPERLDWTGADVGRFYRPVKKPVTVRLDADVIAWLKAEGSGYQTRINTLLRAAMTNSKGRRKRAG